MHKSEIKSSLKLVYYTCSLIRRISRTKTCLDCQHISGYKPRNPDFATQSVLFTFILGPCNNMHITTLACGFWNLESTDTHSPHSLVRVLSSLTCCSQQLPVSTRKAESSASIAHTHLLLPLTRIPLCNIIPVFWAQYYNPHSKILLRRILKPSTKKTVQ